MREVASYVAGGDSSTASLARSGRAAALDRSDDVLLLRDQPQPYGAPAPLDQTGPPRELAGPAPEPKVGSPVRAKDEQQ